MVDQSTDIFLFQYLVPHMLRNKIRQNRLQYETACRCIDDTSVDYRTHPCMYVKMLSVKCSQNLFYICKEFV